jgi:NifU-like protein
MGVSSARIRAAVDAGALRSVVCVTKACRAGGGCSLCHPEIEEILAEAHGEPYDAGLALENQAVCRQETQARIEGALASLVAPRLAARSARIARVEADGMHVVVTLDGAADAALAALVAEKLRAHVCDELDVEVAWRDC